MATNSVFPLTRSGTTTSRYIVITPVKDEARFIEKTIQSMINQTIRPVVWVIVNDGSTDDTEAIVKRYITQNPWIKLINNQDKGPRQRGKGVIKCFYIGYRTLTEEYDYIVKLDGDISFESSYFESLLEKFNSDPQLGIAGGGLYESQDGKTWILYTTKDHVRGAIKMYRRACFDAIGGLVQSMGWDGIDEWKALSLNWKVRSFLEYSVYHYRFTGAATGYLKSWIEQGDGAYRMGYHPLYMIARGVWHMKDHPYVIGGIAMIIAYFLGWLRQDEILVDHEVRDFVQRTQLRKLTSEIAGRLDNEA
jgi:biofilm PGA synthesis N-glycosyltransferase PgaC